MNIWTTHLLTDSENYKHEEVPSSHKLIQIFQLSFFALVCLLRIRRSNSTTLGSMNLN